MKDRLDIYLLCLVPEKNDRIMVAECDKVSTDAKHCSELLAPRSSAWKSNKNKKKSRKNFLESSLNYKHTSSMRK